MREILRVPTSLRVRPKERNMSFKLGQLNERSIGNRLEKSALHVGAPPVDIQAGNAAWPQLVRHRQAGHAGLRTVAAATGGPLTSANRKNLGRVSFADRSTLLLGGRSSGTGESSAVRGRRQAAGGWRALPCEPAGSWNVSGLNAYRRSIPHPLCSGNSRITHHDALGPWAGDLHTDRLPIRGMPAVHRRGGLLPAGSRVDPPPRPESRLGRPEKPGSVRDHLNFLDRPRSLPPATSSIGGLVACAGKVLFACAAK